MEVDKKLKKDKNNEIITINKINSLNYVYKKTTIKEKYENMVKELRTLNFENIANNKMHHMNFNFLINSILKLKKIINNNNPFMKYIKYVKPYNLNNTKINIGNNVKNLLLEEKNIIDPKKEFLKKNEKILNFNKNRKNCRNFFFSRMCNIECKRINMNRIDKIILLQKNIRGFLSKKIINEKINQEIAKNVINNILIIQRAVRNFLLKKKSLDNLIINIIKTERFSKGNKITDLFCLYHYRNLYKKNLIIKKIIDSRNYSASLIQSEFKSFLVNKRVKEILKKEKQSYILTYPFKAENVQIKIYMDKPSKYRVYNYFICPIRKYFITYIDKNSIKPGEYLCHLKVNNIVKIDNRYRFINKNNILYNLISFGEYLFKKPKPKQIEIELVKKIKKIKKQKVKDRKINDELDNFYYYYYYNDNNSNSTNSEHEKNKIDYRKQIDEDDPDQVIDVTGKFYNSKINNFLLNSNYKYLKDNKSPDLKRNNTGKANKNKLPQKKIESMKKLKEDDEINDDSIDFKNNEGNLCQSQTIDYNNILDELSQSASSIVSNISVKNSVKNINNYSKKTHKTKFSKNRSPITFGKENGIKNQQKKNKKSQKKKSNSKTKNPKVKYIQISLKSKNNN